MPMQLSRIVAVHKALADPTRVRILVLLSRGPLHGQAIAGKLGLTPPTITHHMAKLREVGVVTERRDKNTIYFFLNEKALTSSVADVLDLVLNHKQEASDDAVQNEVQVKVDKERQDTIQNFFTADGKLKHLPAKHTKKLYVLEHMVRAFKMGTKYPEKQVNEVILQFHEDYATIRREFIIHQYMYRDNGVYELNPPEMWPTPRGVL